MSLPSFLSLYNQLISIPTISSVNHEKLDFSNKALIDKLANWFETLGFTIDIQPVPNTRNKFNMLASYSNNENQTQGGLLLSGHSDTVPFDAGLWHKDPFTLTEDNNKLYGLGTADMKGFFAFILDALRDMDLKKMTKPIYILATADEETTMAGAAFFSKQTKLQPDCTIIGEPTSLIPIRAHKGFISNSIKVIGQSGHSSDPEKGINAIEIMHLVIERLLILKQKFKTEYHNEGFSIPYPTLNLGIIHGGDAANRICGCCELIIDIRVLPNNNIDSIFNALCDALQPVMTKYPDRIKIEYAVSPIPGYECEKTNPTLTHIEKLVGKKAQTVNYSTEAPYLNEISPTVVLGPGSIEQAHQPDEFISMDFLKPTKMMFERLIKDFCF